MAWTREFIGRELDWIGTDADGRVGYFSSAGRIAVPDAARLFEDDDVHGDTLRSCRITGGVDLHDASGRIVGDWLEVARRGFYAFDIHEGGDVYALIASPRAPITASSLPERVRRYVVVVDLPSLATLTVLDPARWDSRR